MKIVMFVEVDEAIVTTMCHADLDDNGTKAFGDYIIATTEKRGNLKKLVSGRIIAAYREGEVVIKDRIKMLSTGTKFIFVEDFKDYCEYLLNPSGVYKNRRG